MRKPIMVGNFTDEELSIVIFQTSDESQERELLESLRDIRNSRKALGKFTVGDMMEAIYGDEYARRMRGKLGSLYETRMSEVELETKPVDGGVSTRLSKKMLDRIPKSKESKPDKKKLNEVLEEREESLSLDQIINTLSDMSGEERSALMNLIDRMGKKR